jgi:outer membrane protein assembly factor BamA
MALIACLVAPDTASASTEEDTAQATVSTDIKLSHNTNVNVYPYAYYTPEVELAFGIGGIVTFYTAEDALLRPSKLGLSGFYSTNDQYAIGLSPQLYFMENTLFLSLKLFFSDRIYFTPSVENPEVEAQVYGVATELHFPALLRANEIKMLGLMLDYQHVEIKDDALNAGQDGPHTFGVGPAWIWDTRDNIFYPTSGGMYRMQSIFFMKDIGSSYDFNRYMIDLRQYLGINPQLEQVVAIQLLGDFERGNPPFYRLPAMGGSRIMRGYKSGTFRDRNLVCAQVEYRTHIWWRFGAVAFLGAGNVADEFDDLKLNDLKLSYGCGMRFKFNPAEGVNLRVDLGFGDDTDGIYFGIQEAF